MDYWVLGFLWGCGRFSGNHFLVQHENKLLVERVRDVVDIKKVIFSTKRNNSISWRIKIHPKNPYIQWMLAKGYEGRVGNEQRDIPAFELIEKEAEFLRGYFSIHNSIDTFVNTKGKFKGKRIRFYAAENILNRLNQHLHEQLGTTLKKVQKHRRNSVCHILYYQSKKEVPCVIEYLDLTE
jgi:hypothetical protein